MKNIFKLGVNLVFALLGLPLLFLADVIFSVAGASWELKCVVVALVVLSSIPFYLVVRKWIEKNGPNELQLLIFSVCWGAFFLLLMTFAQNLRQSQGISSYWSRMGNCGALFSPISGSEMTRSWMDSRRPAFHYAIAVAEDFCRLDRLYQDLSSSEPSVCGSMGISDRDKCYRRAFEEIMVKEPLTLPGVDMALLEGLALSLTNSSNGTDRLSRVRENFRVAAETFDLVQTSLDALQRHATPEAVIGFSRQFGSQEDPKLSGHDEEWNWIKLVYRRHSLSANEETRLLMEMDRKLEEKFDREIFEKIKRINERLAAENKSDDPLVKVYKVQIEQFNQHFSEFNSKTKGT
jgi:hypothetical protein